MRDPRRPGKLDRLASTEYEKLRALAHALRRRVPAARAVPGTDSLVHETWAVLTVSERTVKEDWRQAREWLAAQLRSDSGVES